MNKYNITNLDKFQIPGNNNIMESLIHSLSEKVVEQHEKAIKESALQGYKYMIMKTEYDRTDNTIKGITKYHGINSLEGADFWEKEGYEIYDLSKVKEYLGGLL